MKKLEAMGNGGYYYEDEIRRRADAGGCGCPPGYSETPGRRHIPRSFPLDRSSGCGSPLGGFAEAKALVGYRSNAGAVDGGVDQPIPKTTLVTAGDPVVPFTTGLIPLPDTDGIISQTRGMKIRKLSCAAFATGGDGKDAFDRDAFFNSAILFVVQGRTLLYRVSLFKLKVTDFGRLGYDCQIAPVGSDFNGVTFEIVGTVPTDGALNYTVNTPLTAQWA